MGKHLGNTQINGMIIIVLLIVGCTKKVIQPIEKGGITTQQNHLWQPIDPSDIPVSKKQKMPIPSEFRTYFLNTKLMRQSLSNTMFISKGEKNETPIIELPSPEGVMMKYKLTETATVDKALLEKYPQLLTYSGKGVDDASSTARLDFMPGGFHAYILSTKGSVIIRPCAEGDTIHYYVYYKQFSGEVKKPFEVSPDTIPQRK
ncbi:MAG: hypothetical protein WCO63_13035 [Bacteroidota bacterium]